MNRSDPEPVEEKRRFAQSSPLDWFPRRHVWTLPHVLNVHADVVCFPCSSVESGGNILININTLGHKTTFFLVDELQPESGLTELPTFCSRRIYLRC